MLDLLAPLQETAQPSGEDSGDHRPLNSSMENSPPSRDLEEPAEINEANPIPSPPSQPQSFSSNDYATNAEAQVFNQADDQTQGDVDSATNAEAQVFNKAADQTQGDVDSATDAEAQVFNNAADQTQGDVGTSTRTPSQQMSPMEENRSVLNLVSASHDSDQLSHSSSTSSHAANPNANIHGYMLRSDLVAIFEAINAKYGDVTQNCTLSSKLFRYPFLENLCQIVKTLQAIPLHDFNDDDQLIMEMLESVADMEKVGFNMEWLNLHLVKIKKIMELNKANSALKNTRDQQLEIVDLLKNSIELKEEELSKLRSQFSEAMAKYDQIYHEIEVIKSGLEQCHMDTLVDGLL
ncbi:hypothetical protein F0562_008134 [Nyssa sinensis]|uniref:MATH domain-containing protein n=1 Tax=Nyssa sinensis TaxID=561372 RepID=A0A5J5A703_9ASTE|nr:hypothetical protein F0562_008134 [Nyssa sinensis]